MILVINGCSKVNEIEIEIAESVRSNSTSELKVIRTGTGSGEWDIADKDGFNYYFTSHPAGKFDVEILKEKENDYCHTTESNVVTDKVMHNEVKRDMLIREKDKGEFTIAIACHKNIYRFFATDSVVSVQMIIEDVQDKVRDTAVFEIIRRPSVN